MKLRAELVRDKQAAADLAKQHLAADPRVSEIEKRAPEKMQAWLRNLDFVFNITDGVNSAGVVMFEPRGIMHTQIAPQWQKRWFSWGVADTITETVFKKHKLIFTAIPDADEGGMLSFAQRLGFIPVKAVSGRGTLLVLTPVGYEEARNGRG